VLLFCSWPHRRVFGCCATVLQLGAQKGIRLLCYCSAVGRTEWHPVVVLLFCSWPHRIASGCFATVLQSAAQNSIRLLCYCSAVGRTEEYPVVVPLFFSWPHRRLSGCCVTVLQLAVEKKSIRFQQQQWLRAMKKNRKYSKASDRNFLEPN